jgi:hypothetical protein
MTRSKLFRFSMIVLIGIGLSAGLAGTSAAQQDQPIPLQVESAVTGELSATNSLVIYSFNVAESLRMGFNFDVIKGDMQPTLVVMDQAQNTLGGATGPNANGLVVKFPAAGTYYVVLSADSGTSATYRLFIDADPPLPIDPFVLQSWLVAGTSNQCSENTWTGNFTPTEDLNVCFTLSLITDPIELKTEWWSPSGKQYNDYTQTITSDSNEVTWYLSGLSYGSTPFEEGWWQLHISINGELAYIQWVPVRAAQ